MLYEVTSPLFMLASLSVLASVVYGAKCFFDHRMAELDQKNDSKTSSVNA